MLKFIVTRLISLIPVVFMITLILFGVLKMMPGDQAAMMINPALRAADREEAYQAARIRLGLDKPLPTQYFMWLANTARGDFGWSTSHNRPVGDAVKEPFRNTVILNFFVIIFQLSITIPIGIVTAVRRGSIVDKFFQTASLITYSMPSFFVGLSLIFLIAINLRLLPAGGMPLKLGAADLNYYISWLRHMALPVTTLVIIGLASTIRYVRNAMLDALGQDYIRTARAKGLSEKVVIYSHAFRNALIPISTIMIWAIFSLFSGSAITETIFAWNGIGKVLVDALNNRDFMLIITLNLFFSGLSLMANFVADITYGLIDPRIKMN